MLLRLRPSVRALTATAALGAASLAAAGLPGPLLKAAGGALVVHEEELAPADVVVISTGADGAGVLEAADLVHSGVAGRVAVFADPPDPVVDREFLRRGVPYEDAAAREVRQLRALGVDRVEQIPRAVAGSEDEGAVLPEWCRREGIRSVIVVTTADHSRRVRRLLRRSMEGQPTRVIVRPARFSQFDPDGWWDTRGGLRTGIVEIQKLLFDVARHPMS
jgi:hypothetical protein